VILTGNTSNRTGLPQRPIRFERRTHPAKTLRWHRAIDSQFQHLRQRNDQCTSSRERWNVNSGSAGLEALRLRRRSLSGGFRRHRCILDDRPSFLAQPKTQALGRFSYLAIHCFAQVRRSTLDAQRCCASTHFVVLCSSFRRLGGDAAVGGMVWGFEIGGSSSCFDFEVSFQ
jgi:hypothetical protein